MKDSSNSTSGSNQGLFNIKNLTDFCPDVICALDKDGRFLYVSASAKSDWGYDPSELVGSSLLDHIREVDQPQTMQKMAAAKSSLVPIRFKNGFKCKSGNIKPMLWSANWDAKEEVLYGVARDGVEVMAAKEKAKKYEQRLYKAYKLARLGWWEWNIHGEQIDAADELYELYGICKEQYPVFSTGAYLSLVHPDALPFVLENIAVFWRMPYHQYQHRIRKPSGEIIYVELNVQTVKDENNNIIQVHGIVKDITEQKKQEKRLEFVAKATSEVIWEREIQAEEVFINAEKFKNLFGYEIKDNTIPRSFWLGNIHPEDIQSIHENREYALHHGRDFYLNEYRFQKADSSWAYLKNRVYVIRDFDGQPVSLLGAIEDITRQKLFEKALIENKESYRQLFENGPLPAIICDVESLCVLDVNTIAIEQYGYSKNEFLSKTFLDFLSKEEHQRVARFMKEMKPQVRNDIEIMPHIKKGGKQVMVEVLATIIRYNGKAAILATANDVTEKLRVQKQIGAEKINHQKSITKAAIEAQEKERSEIGKELHDNINQLLAAAKLYLENIRHFADQEDNFIDKSIALLNQSINENRRLSHALVAPKLADTGFKEILLELMQTFRELKMFDIHHAFDFEEKQLDAGIQLTIYRILQESFNNTVKYAKASAVNLSISHDDSFLHLAYKDNGIGFDPSTVKMGIGLNNIKNRAEAYNGKVQIISSAGNGYQLYIWFSLKS